MHTTPDKAVAESIVIHHQQVTDDVKRLIAAELQCRFGNRFVFDPIRVTEKTDTEGDPYVHVEIVFNGGTNKQRLRELAEGSFGLMTSVREQLWKEGCEADVHLHPSFIEESVWNQLDASTTS